MKHLTRTGSIILAIAMILTAFMGLSTTVSAKVGNYFNLDFTGLENNTAPDGMQFLAGSDDYLSYEYVTGVYGKTNTDSALKFNLKKRDASATYRLGISRPNSNNEGFWGNGFRSNSQYQSISFQLAAKTSMPTVRVAFGASIHTDFGSKVTFDIDLASLPQKLEADKWYNVEVVAKSSSSADGNLVYGNGYCTALIYVDGVLQKSVTQQLKATSRVFGGLSNATIQAVIGGTDAVELYVDNFKFGYVTNDDPYSPEAGSGVAVATGSSYVIDSGVITADNLATGAISISDFENGLTFSDDIAAKRYYKDKTLTTAISASGSVKEGNYLVVEKTNGNLYTYEIKDTLTDPTPPTDVKTIFDLDFTGTGNATAPEGFSFVEANAGTEYKSYEYVSGIFGKAADDSALKISLAERENAGTVYRFGLTRDTADSTALWSTFRPTWGDKLMYSFQIAVGMGDVEPNLFFQTKAVGANNINEGAQQKIIESFHVNQISPKMEKGQWYNVNIIVEPSNVNGDTVWSGSYIKTTVYVDGAVAYRSNVPTAVASSHFGGLKEASIRCLNANTEAIEFYLDNYSFKRLRWGTSNLGSDASLFPVYAIDSSKGVEVADGSDYVLNSGVITVDNMVDGTISIVDFEKELFFTDVAAKRYYTNKNLSTVIDNSGSVKGGNYLVVQKTNGNIYTYKISDVNVSDEYIVGSFVLKSGDDIIDVENTSITPGTYTLSFETADNNNIAGNVMVIVAAYNGNQLVYCESKPATLGIGVNTVSFDGEVTIPANGITAVKAFVWNSELVSQIQKCSIWD